MSHSFQPSQSDLQFSKTNLNGVGFHQFQTRNGTERHSNAYSKQK